MVSALGPVRVADPSEGRFRMSKQYLLVDGMTAGLLGALAVAAWFLIADLGYGHPFETPALLGAILFHGFRAAPAAAGHSLQAAYIVEYSLAHFAAFALLGWVAAWLVCAANRFPVLLALLMIFFAVSEILFVSLVIRVGPSLLPSVTWWSVLVGNLLATTVILGYFYVRHPELGGGLLTSSLGVVTEGTLAGLIGGAMVAMWFLLFDIQAGHPLRTPEILGAAVIGEASGALDVSAGFVLLYTVLHFVAFVAFGIVVAALLAATERKFLLPGLILLIALVAIFFVGFVTIVDQSVREKLVWWRIEAGNLLASVGIVVFFLTRHRGLIGRAVEGWREGEKLFQPRPLKEEARKAQGRDA